MFFQERDCLCDNCARLFRILFHVESMNSIWILGYFDYTVQIASFSHKSIDALIEFFEILTGTRDKHWLQSSTLFQKPKWRIISRLGQSVEKRVERNETAHIRERLAYRAANLRPSAGKSPQSYRIRIKLKFVGIFA